MEKTVSIYELCMKYRIKKYGKIVIIPLSHLIKHNPHERGSGELYKKIKCEKNSKRQKFLQNSW